MGNYLPVRAGELYPSFPAGFRVFLFLLQHSQRMARATRVTSQPCRRSDPVSIPREGVASRTGDSTRIPDNPRGRTGELGASDGTALYDAKLNGGGTWAIPAHGGKVKRKREELDFGPGQEFAITDNGVYRRSSPSLDGSGASAQTGSHPELDLPRFGGHLGGILNRGRSGMGGIVTDLSACPRQTSGKPRPIGE